MENELVSYDSAKSIIRRDLESMSRKFITIGYYLKLIRDNEMYRQVKDFYADLMEYMRTHPDKGHGNASINNMYEFAKVSCDLLKTDLTDFFEAWGFFVTGTFEVGDYANYRFEITPKMVEDTKKYIASKHYPKPEKDLTLLTD